MKSLVVKRSVVINGHKTSVSLEDEFWSGLKEIAKTQHASLSIWCQRSTKRAKGATYLQRSVCSYSTGSARLVRQSIWIPGGWRRRLWISSIGCPRPLSFSAHGVNSASPPRRS